MEITFKAPKFCQSIENYQAYIQAEIDKQQLPEAAIDSFSTSYELALNVCRVINEKGFVSFSEFMQMALYEPGLGYYAAGNQKFGSGGDFVTAPEISSLFAQCFANQFAQAFEVLSPNVLEFGAGSGIFAADTLIKLEELNALPEQYFILEVSAELRARQKQTLLSKAPKLLKKVTWLDELPNKYNGVVFANEVVDAIPVELFRKNKEQLEKAYVTSSDEGFVFDWQTCNDSDLTQKITSDCSFEQRPLVEPWLKSLIASCQKATLLLVDYGYSEDELYHSSRTQGSLQHYYRHHKTSNPLALVGMQDITSSVDFTQLALTADQNDCELLGYCSQSMFLMAAGIDGLAQQKMESMAPSDTMAALRVGQELKQLMMPDEMGESCKVLAFSKGVDFELSGFALDNQLHRL